MAANLIPQINPERRRGRQERGLPHCARPPGSLRLAISAALRFSCPHRNMIAAQPPRIREAIKNRALSGMFEGQRQGFAQGEFGGCAAINSRCGQECPRSCLPRRRSLHDGTAKRSAIFFGLDKPCLTLETRAQNSPFSRPERQLLHRPNDP